MSNRFFVASYLNMTIFSAFGIFGTNMAHADVRAFLNFCVFQSKNNSEPIKYTITADSFQMIKFYQSELRDDIHPGESGYSFYEHFHNQLTPSIPIYLVIPVIKEGSGGKVWCTKYSPLPNEGSGSVAVNSDGGSPFSTAASLFTLTFNNSSGGSSGTIGVHMRCGVTGCTAGVDDHVRLTKPGSKTDSTDMNFAIQTGGYPNTKPEWGNHDVTVADESEIFKVSTVTIYFKN